MPISIEQPVQLIVEGRDDEGFLTALLRHIGLTSFQIHTFQQVSSLTKFLKALVLTPGFSTNAEAVGIIIDADDSFEKAFNRAATALSQNNLVPPREVGVKVGKPISGIFVLPDCSSAGCLENLILTALEESTSLECSRQFLQCTKQRRNVAYPEKTLLHSYLASREQPGLKIGEAAKAKYFPFDATAFAPLRQYLSDLAGRQSRS